MPRPIHYFAASGLVLVAVAASMSVELAGLLIRGEPLDAWSHVLVHAIGFGTAIAIGVQGAEVPAQSALGLRRVRLSVLAGLVPLAIGVSILLSELDNWVQEVFPASPEELATSIGAIVASPGALVHVVLVAPVFEELFFRGVLQQRLAAGYGAGPAIVFTAGAFALAHMGFTPPRYLPELVLAGLLLGWIARRTGSTVATATVHVLYNAAPIVGSAGVLRLRGWSVTLGTNGPDHVGPAFVAAAAGLTALGIFALLREPKGEPA